MLIGAFVALVGIMGDGMSMAITIGATLFLLGWTHR